MRFVCPTMHAEHLHMEPVWAATRATLERSRLRWTMFIDPLLPRIEGIDIAPVLAWIADHGHEVAMHTHHHKLVGEPGHTTGFVLGEELSEADIHRCLQENFDYFTERGHEPKGFVSGSWLVLDEIYEWLAAHEFDYDSTLRTYAPAGHWSRFVDDAPCPTARRVNGLLEVPTTSPITPQLTATVLRSPRSVALGNLVYDLYYLHDYDLVRPHKRMAARLLDRLAPDSAAATVSELAQGVAELVPR